MTTPLEKKSKTTPDTILITGGCGFIGSWLIKELLLHHSTPYRIINLDALTYCGNLDNVKEVAEHPHYRFVQGDIRDKALVNKLMYEADICINVAAQTHVDRSIDGPEVFVDTNVMGTQTLLEAARLNNLDKFIQISTDEVYGSLPLESDDAFSESSPLQPSSPYSASKTGADLLVTSYFHTYGLDVCVTRCSNNYGPYQYPEKLIPVFALNAKANQKVPVYGDGLNVRDWIHVQDHVRAVIKVLESGKAGEVYNIGASNERNNLEMTKKILAMAGRDESLIDYVTDRLGHDRRYAIDSSKIQTELGWHPEYNADNFDAGLQETVTWYLENTEWVDAVQARHKAMLASGEDAFEPVRVGG